MKELHEVIINEISAEIQLLLDEKNKQNKELTYRLLQDNNKIWLVGYLPEHNDDGGCILVLEEITFKINRSTYYKKQPSNDWFSEKLGFTDKDNMNSNRRKGKGDDGIDGDDGGMPIQVIKITN